MKTEVLNAAMKALSSTQDNKMQSAIEMALNTLSSQEDKAVLNAFTPMLGSFREAKSRHTEIMMKLNDIGTGIRRSEKERKAVLEESDDAEQSWRSRFRALRGAISPEMKAEHSQRMANRELAEEFTALIGELETDKTRTMLGACATGGHYVAAHSTAFRAYAQNEWSAAIRDISPGLIRAFCLRLRELEMMGDETPKRTLIAELGERILTQSQFYSFNMENEPVLSELGLHRPALTGVDMKLYDSPATRMMIVKELAQKAGKKTEG